MTAAGISLAAIVVDQAIKIWVKTHMYMHECIDITSWFKILFTENNGMAFGMELVDKWFLTSFRIVAVAFLIYIMYKIIRQGVDYLFLVCLALVLAGAAGNIIDCLFYGQIFNNPPAPWWQTSCLSAPAMHLPFYGRVVDMFYFPLVEWNWPSWLPFLGGEHFIFFSPIFNFADACISCGVVAILLFCRRQLQALLQ